MAFEAGNKLSKGRPKGALNKATREVRAFLEDYGFNPIEALLDIHKIALTRFSEEAEKQDSGRISPMESQAVKYLKIAADAASDLASYTFPKLKSVEQTKGNALEGMTPIEKLDAMKQAVAFLESQVKGEPA